MNEDSNRVQNLYHSTAAHFTVTTAMSAIGNGKENICTGRCVTQTSIISEHVVCLYSFEINPLNAELNPICHLLALLGGATIVVVSRLGVNDGNFTSLEKENF